jgi:hypothetical protein
MGTFRKGTIRYSDESGKKKVLGERGGDEREKQNCFSRIFGGYPLILYQI